MPIRSTATFTKNRTANTILSKSANAFSATTLSTSANLMIKTNLTKNTLPWDGDNVTSNEFGFDDLFSGVPFGVGSFGGLKHFEKIKNRV